MNSSGKKRRRGSRGEEEENGKKGMRVKSGRVERKERKKGLFRGGFFLDKKKVSTTEEKEEGDEKKVVGKKRRREDVHGKEEGIDREKEETQVEVKEDGKSEDFFEETLAGYEERGEEVGVYEMRKKEVVMRKKDGADLDEIYLAETESNGTYLKLCSSLRKVKGEEKMTSKRERRSEDLASSFGMEFVKFGDVEVDKEESSKSEYEDELEVKGLPPWIQSMTSISAQRHSQDPLIALHYEILDFANFMSASDTEMQVRNALVVRITDIVKSIWPEARVKTFGSFATGLFLPTSDIDLCVLNTPHPGTPSELHLVADAIRSKTGFVRRIEVIEKAFVPLVKLTDRASGVKCDISFGRNNGPSNVRLIRQYLRDFPSLKPLLLVIKCFLQQRMLNEVYSGGIGSYALLLLIVSHLQHYRWNFRHRISSNDPVGPNLGAALVDFFELYGTRFNYVNAGIGIKKNGCFYCKRRKYITDHRQPVLLSIEDPQDEKNEIAKNTFNLQSIKKAFVHAQQRLTTFRAGEALGPTALSRVLVIDYTLMARKTARERAAIGVARPEFPDASCLKRDVIDDSSDSEDDETVKTKWAKTTTIPTVKRAKKSHAENEANGETESTVVDDSVSRKKDRKRRESKKEKNRVKAKKERRKKRRIEDRLGSK